MNEFALKGVTVYLVDDDRGVRDSLAVSLATFGAAVETFASYNQASAAPFSATTGCLVIDIQLQDGNGIELLLGLRMRGVGLPTFLITGRDVPPISRSVSAEIEALLPKPVDGERLAELIAGAIA